MSINNSITQLKGIGDKKALILKTDAGIETIEDFLYYLPRKYIDRSHFKSIKDCFVNETVTISGVITKIVITGHKKKRLEVEISDGTDSVTGIFFGGLKFFQKLFSRNDLVLFSGKITFYKNKQIVHPEFDFIDNASSLEKQSVNTGRIIPLYRSTEALKGISFDSRGFRRTIKTVLDSYLDTITEPFPDNLLIRNNLITIQEALQGIHFPDSFEHAEQARKRLSFNEIFFLQYYLSMSKRHLLKHANKKNRNYDNSKFKKFFEKLPFELTKDQKSAIEEIRDNMLAPVPMNRLLQGDVGSGKTIVAMAASIIACNDGAQTAIMAPTEVLAVQHYNTFKQFAPDYLNITLLTGSKSKKEKEAVYTALHRGEIDIIIGTHALIQKDVAFKKLHLIIIDEQHRFGVSQRAALRQKGENTDLLIMTATPIPRSLSLTLYGDLDVSSIKTKPANRLPITSLAFPMSRLNGVYNSLLKYIKQGRQVYYILPLIEESEKIDLKSAVEVYENLNNNIFPELQIELLHGKLKQETKDTIMRRFQQGEIDILVSTTVIEVGIDVPNANVIIIEHAERFGLSQLHQLRGRVGRGEHKSFCILIHPDSISNESKKRISIIVKTDDGFQISEQDLKMRGAGELIGARQHGSDGDFEFTNLATDIDMIINTRNEAEQIITSYEDAIDDIFNNITNNKYDKLLKDIRKKRILAILS